MNMQRIQRLPPTDERPKYRQWKRKRRLEPHIGMYVHFCSMCLKESMLIHSLVHARRWCWWIDWGYADAFNRHGKDQTARRYTFSSSISFSSFSLLQNPSTGRIRSRSLQWGNSCLPGVIPWDCHFLRYIRIGASVQC